MCQQHSFRQRSKLKKKNKLKLVQKNPSKLRNKPNSSRYNQRRINKNLKTSQLSLGKFIKSVLSFQPYKRNIKNTLAKNKDTQQNRWFETLTRQTTRNILYIINKHKTKNFHILIKKMHINVFKSFKR